MRILHLTLTKQWFDMIASGAKKEEYREIKPYWISRLLCKISSPNGGYFSAVADLNKGDYECKGWKEFTGGCSPFIKCDIIRFKNGYAEDAPEMDVEFEGIKIDYGRIIWGAEKDKKYFALQLGKVLTIKNYKP